jgi:threonine dehydrogenase-like Zn-dependent dehydrogenase
LVNIKTRLGGICGTDLGAISVEQFIVRAKTDIEKGD